MIASGASSVLAQSEPESSNVLELQNQQGKTTARISEEKAVRLTMKPESGLAGGKGIVEQVNDSTLVVGGQHYPITQIQTIFLKHKGFGTVGIVCSILGASSYVFFILFNRGYINTNFEINSWTDLLLFLLFLFALFAFAIALAPLGILFLILRIRPLQMSRFKWRVSKEK